MALADYKGAGQTLSQAVSARYSAIGEEKKRDSLTELFRVRKEQRDELFQTLAMLLQIGDTLAGGYEESKEIEQILAGREEKGEIEKTSGWFRDVISGPQYKRTGLKWTGKGRLSKDIKDFAKKGDLLETWDIIGKEREMTSSEIQNMYLREKYSNFDTEWEY